MTEVAYRLTDTARELLAGEISLRSCASCGTELEDWGHPLELGAYVPCYPCGRVYLVTAPGLDAVDRAQLPDELRLVVDEFSRLWWEIQVVPVPAAG